MSGTVGVAWSCLTENTLGAAALPVACSAWASVCERAEPGTVSGVSRTCARPGCARGAAATLSYAYADGLVVIEDLADEAHPMLHDLCGVHAAGLKVPIGWVLNDRRHADDGVGHGSSSLGQLDLIGA